MVFHEEYGRPDNYQNDIALIKLDREVRGCLIGDGVEVKLKTQKGGREFIRWPSVPALAG